MEDTTKTKKNAPKGSKSKSKNKSNHEPKWKAKKDGTSQKNVQKNTSKDKKVEENIKEEKIVKEEIAAKEENNVKEDKVVEEKHIEENVKESISNLEKTGKKVDKERLIDKYNIENTEIINLPSKEELDKLYENMTKEQTIEIPTSVEEAEEDKLPEENKSSEVENDSKEDSITIREKVRQQNFEKRENSIRKEVLKKQHYNYLSRISTLVAMILLFLVLCILFVFKAIDYKLGGSTTYSEYTSNDYKVCLSADNTNCIGKDSEYNANEIKSIHGTFNYEAVYNRKYNFESKYYVLESYKVIDRNNSSNILTTEEHNLINPTKINIKGEVITFSTDVDIDFSKYKAMLDEYNEKQNTNHVGQLEVGLYLKDGDISRKISFITIPLSEEHFSITSSNLDNQNQLVIKNTRNKTIDPFYIFVAVICLLMDILLFIYLLNFIYMVKDLDSAYKSKLKRILKEHDDIIVNATSSYTIGDDCRVIEVESFEELLDARNSLEKPIVYEKINSIKSKFYLEDGNTVYVYQMKDDGE